MRSTTYGDELLYVQTDLLSVTIKGRASHPEFPDVAFDDLDATLRVSCDDTYDLQIAGKSDLLALQKLTHGCIGQYCMQPLFFEYRDYEIVIVPHPGHTAEFWHENYNVRKSVTPVSSQLALLSGIVNFGSDIGLSDLVIRVDGKEYLRLTIEVFPSKISYKEDYKAIVADVTAEVYNLVFDFLKRTYHSFDISDEKQASPVEFYAIICKIYQEFLTAADIVMAKPHHILETEHVVLQAHKIRQTDNRSVRWIEKHPDHALRTPQGFRADRALAVVRHVTYDTKENRLTKYMLQSTVKRLKSFRRNYAQLDRKDDEQIAGINGMIKSIQRRYNTGFMREVTAAPMGSGMSLVFTMAPGYRDLYRCYLLLQHGLSVTGSLYNMSVKDLSVLYEYWCFIKLNSLMREKYDLQRQNILKTAGNGLCVTLAKGQESVVQYRNPETGELITLSYNPLYRRKDEKSITDDEFVLDDHVRNGSATLSQKPDNVLSLEKHGSGVNYQYVFDAKYKIDPARKGSMYACKYGAPGPQEGDINTMHRYRDAIVYQSGVSSYERAMFGAYVLFPYHNEEEYRNHPFYKSIAQVNIGGLPFLPSATRMVSEMLDQLINEGPDEAFSRTTLPAGIELHMTHIEQGEIPDGHVDP